MPIQRAAALGAAGREPLPGTDRRDGRLAGGWGR